MSVSFPLAPIRLVPATINIDLTFMTGESRGVINKGYRGKFILFPELVETLYQSIADHTQDKVLKTFAAYDCLLIDELGFIEIEPVQVGLFFTLMHRRHKTKSTLITSNLGFEEWKTFMRNPQMTAALLDRLTECSHVINMKSCVSLRSKLDTV